MKLQATFTQLSVKRQASMKAAACLWPVYTRVYVRQRTPLTIHLKVVQTNLCGFYCLNEKGGAKCFVRTLLPQ